MPDLLINLTDAEGFCLLINYAEGKINVMMIGFWEERKEAWREIRCHHDNLILAAKEDVSFTSNFKALWRRQQERRFTILL